MPISDPPPGMMKSNPDAGTMSLSGTMNKAISAGKALEVEAEVAAERYTYSIANTGEIEVRVPLGRAAGKRDVAVDIKETRLALGLKGEEPAVAGSLWGKIDPDESHWQLDEGGTVLVATLAQQAQRDLYPCQGYITTMEFHTRRRKHGCQTLLGL